MNDKLSTEKEPLKLLTAREAASYLRVSLSTLYRMEQVGQLTPLRTPGGHRRYTVSILNACLAPAGKEAPTGASQDGTSEPSYA
ncbi:MAG: excisionase family DNA-binding protein [Chloroflexota bacterium]